MAVKVKTIDQDGRVRWKYAKGLNDAHMEVRIGIDPLPSTLTDGIVILETEGQLVVWEKNLDLEIRTPSIEGFPADAVIEFAEAKRRLRRPTGGDGDTADDMSIINQAMDILRADGARYTLQHTPFTGDKQVYLLEVLSKVRSGGLFELQAPS